MPLIFSIVKTREERYALFVADVRRSLVKWKRERDHANALYDHYVDLLAEASSNFDELEKRLTESHERFFDGLEFDPQRSAV